MLELTTTTPATVLTMTSREIAELTGKNHADVLRDIRTMLDVLKKDASSFAGIYQDAYGRDKPCFNLDRELTLTLVSGYDIALRHRVVTRLGELEARPTQPAQPSIPQTLPEALRLAADLAEQKAKTDAALAIAAPKAKALDRIATETSGAVCLRVAAKLLQMQEKQFLQFASAEGYIFRNHHSRIWQGYATAAKSGLVELKLTTIERDDGSSRTAEQVLITRQGIAKLAERLEKRAAATLAMAA